MTASARRYRNRSSHDAAAITRGSVIAPSSTATSGKTSWMLNTNGARREPAASQPATPSGSGGDITITASGPNLEPIGPRRPPAR